MLQVLQKGAPRVPLRLSMWRPWTQRPSFSTRFSNDNDTTLSSSSSSSLPPPALTKVLIANRGEIACRVIRTCQRLEIPTVALYSVADGKDALHAQMADEAYQIGSGPTPAESYLLQDEIVELAQQVGAQAIHPGYGFLSENALFAQRIQQEPGLLFVGPPLKAIQSMGSKSESKAIMDQANVPTTPGYYDTSGDVETQSVEFLQHKATEIGYPVLIKAVLGGGGKGMRLVWHETEFAEALASCQREAQAAFGDGRVLLEKYLVRPRHVEVQIVADTHGNVVSLYERDCSLQRRHQKIIEEAPASDLSRELRQQLGKMGRQAAQAVGYVNAGTVEFLLDTQALEEGRDAFYFCEMNTRLQVEHPITECITGVDLVEWQLRVAAGEPLPITDSNDIACHGHAFEARIYAEQPTNNFLPATGHVWHHAPPVTQLNTPFEDNAKHRVRVDTCIQAGQDVSVYYDPMISKLIVHGKDRAEALNQLITSLKTYQSAGVPTNIDFLIQCAQHPTFHKAGAVNTGFLEDHADDLNLDPENFKQQQSPPMAQAVGAYSLLLYMERRRGLESSPTHPWSSRQGSWRMGGSAGRARRKLQIHEQDETIECISNPNGSFDVLVPDAEGTQTFQVSGGYIGDTPEMQIEINATQTVRLSCVLREDAKGVVTVKMWPRNLPNEYSWEVKLENPLNRSHHVAGSSSLSGSGQVKAPMPGKISRVNFKQGDQVQEGDVVVVMEAMKMEHSIKATCNGILTTVHCNVGDLVGDDDILCEISAPEIDHEEEDVK